MSAPTEPRDDSDHLASCPFCGSEAEGLTMDAEQDDLGAGAMFVQCTNSRCMASLALIYPLGDDPKPLLLERWNRRASQSDGTSGVPKGWRIEPDEEGMRVVSPSGDGCYVWDKDSLNSPAFMGICQREVFRQLCQSLVFPAPSKSQGEQQ